jgi:hypothetical protein
MKKMYEFIDHSVVLDFKRHLLDTVPYKFAYKLDETSNVIQIQNLTAEQFVFVDELAVAIALRHNAECKISISVSPQDRYNELKQAILNGQRLRDAQQDLSALERMYAEGELDNGYFKPIVFPEKKKLETSELLCDSLSPVKNR